ncbi:hypothetical protein [Bacillus thuringiensis]|nr:hypothetical protein [Bacillus thuringiensis]MCU7668535.1 hypothetical protein [Bacillus thuringiensis]
MANNLKGLEEFDTEMFEMHSPNNMQSVGNDGAELSAEEQKEIDNAFI